MMSLSAESHLTIDNYAKISKLLTWQRFLGIILLGVTMGLGVMKTYVMCLLIGAVVCSSVLGNVPRAMTEAAERGAADMAQYLLSGITSLGRIPRPVSIPALGYGGMPGPIAGEALREERIASTIEENLNRRAAKIIHAIDANMPLPRAMILRQLGVSPHHWLTAEAQDFKDIVTMNIKHMPRYASESRLAGDELLDTGLARYLPSVYELSADDVLASFDALDDFGNVRTGRLSSKHEKVFNLKDVVSIVNDALGDTGRRELIDNLNRLDVDEAAELTRELSLAWNLRVAQAGAEGEGEPSPLDIRLRSIMSKKQHQLELNKEIRGRAPAFAPSAEEIAQQEKELNDLQTLADMPHSAEKDTALAEFHADHLTDASELLFFTNRDLAWLRRTKIGQAALQDVNLSALAVLDQVAELLSYVLADLHDKTQRREQLLDLLDEHVQQALATD